MSETVFVRARTRGLALAFAAREVERPFPYLEPTPLPGTQAFVLGLVLHEDQPLVVLDIGQLCGGESAPRTFRLLLPLRDTSQGVGFAVDEVLPTITVDDGGLAQATAVTAASPGGRLIRGAVHSTGELWLVVDTRRVLALAPTV